jgi:SAM-dependent methyltransferase
MSFKDTQIEEAKTWVVDDPKVFEDKKQREVVRYPLLKKQMGLNYLDTTNMYVADVGAGPFGGVSSVLNCRMAIRVEPLMHEYAKIADVQTYVDTKAEEFDYGDVDLVISTNAIDHFEDPSKFFNRLLRTLPSGGYFAHYHAINNAFSHPHHAHEHNINPEFVKNFLWDSFELVWNLDYQNDGLVYGWRKQPAFAQLWRKVTGYDGKK